MMRVLRSLILCGILASFSLNAQAWTIRYAIIIGSNTGLDYKEKRQFDALKHAEREAILLRRQLVKYSHFDDSDGRTKLLTGATRAQVREAVRALVRQKSEDEALLGNVESIFLFYYTGHGLEGRLLLSDGPLVKDQLVEYFNEINADFSIGVFDACYAASIVNMSPKGMDATVGLNMVKNLPQEVLSAKGSIWYVSSESGNPSYEDSELGGVFTHFFIEALYKAERDGPGITLDRIWEYVQKRTGDYTSARNRRQRPQKIVSKLKSSAPVYFSFLESRNAKLVLSNELKGKFVLSYVDNHLAEILEKKQTGRQQWDVYPGRARIRLLGDSSEFSGGKVLELSANERVVVHESEETGLKPALGEHVVTVDNFVDKGLSSQQSIKLSRLQSGLSMIGGAGYSYSLAAKEMLNPRHQVGIPLRVDFGQFILKLDMEYGYDRRRFGAWGYTVHMASAGGYAGYARFVGRARLNAFVGFTYGRTWQIFDTDQTKVGQQFQPSLGLSATIPPQGKFYIEPSINVGGLRAPGAAMISEVSWHWFASVGVSIYFRIV